MNRMEHSRLTAPARFWAKVKRGAPKACWLWKGGSKNGYGVFIVAKIPVYAHRFSYELNRGEIPAGLDVCHTCDVRLCVNPRHFFTGTRAENLEDMRKKGRAAPMPKLTGLWNPNAHLTTVQVAELRSLFSRSSQRDLAARFGVSQSTVWRIGKGVTRNVG